MPESESLLQLKSFEDQVAGITDTIMYYSPNNATSIGSRISFYLTSQLHHSRFCSLKKKMKKQDAALDHTFIDSSKSVASGRNPFIFYSHEVLLYCNLINSICSPFNYLHLFSI
mgnify:CR=1 FL=1